jgi:hypothetical protein
VKRARGRRTETRSHPHFIAAMIRRRVSIPARRKGRAGVFPLPREPARATRRRPEIAPVRRAQPSSGETNPSRVSPQPGCGVGFRRSWPGATSGQGRKQVRLQPMGAKPTWANLTNTPSVSLCSGGLSCVVKKEAKGRGGTWSGLVSCLISPAMTSSYFLLLLACMLPSAPIGSWKPRACTLLLR